MSNYQKNPMTGFAPRQEPSDAARIAALEESLKLMLESRDHWRAACEDQAKAWADILPEVEVDTSESNDPQDATSVMLPDDLRERLLVELIEEHADWLDERGAELYWEWLDGERGEAMIARHENRVNSKEW